MAETPGRVPDDFIAAVQQFTDLVRAYTPALTAAFTAASEAFTQAYDKFSVAGYLDECSRPGCHHPRALHGLGTCNGRQFHCGCALFITESD